MKRLVVSLFVLIVVLAAAAALVWALWLRPVDSAVPPALAGHFDTVQLEHGGRPRSYGLYLPHPNAAANGIVVVLHGSLGTGEQFRRWTGRSFDALGDRLGVAVLYPDGWKRHWNDCRRIGTYAAKQQNVDDVAFLDHVIARLTADRRTRVGVIGYSNGGVMALRWALEGQTPVDGLVMAGAAVPDAENMACRERRPLPRALVLAGTEDKFSPYTGGHVRILGSDRGVVRSAEDSVRWLAGEGASEVAEVKTQTGPVQRRSWRSATGHRADLLTLQGGGHTVPQPRTHFPKLLGPTVQSIDAAELAAQTFGWSTEPAASRTP